eukprot:1161661-Amorphochlora_amoeboformis.AAC.1
MLLELFAVIIASVRSEGTARDFHPRLSKGRRFGGPYVCGSAMSTLHRLRGAGMTSPWEDFEEVRVGYGGRFKQTRVRGIFKRSYEFNRGLEEM